ncbi:MAG: ComEC/Rec2 family competence protein [Flavobacteriaceae bacterium]|nr:ComEC/Rec2 family competence protein [Flavobacteriaceae bacterium]
MNKQPLLICAISFGLGIFFQDKFDFPFWGAATTLVLGIVGFLAGFFIRNFFFDRLKSAFLIFLFFGIGIFLHFLNTNSAQNFDFEKNKTTKIVFQLSKKLNSNERNKRYEVEILNFEKPFSAVISIPKEQQELDFLHFYSAEAYLNSTQKPQYDFQFDYQKYLARQNIHYQGFIPNEILFKKKESVSFADKIKQKRLDLLFRIDNSSLQPQNKAILKGIILADRTEINQEIINHFSKTGLIHILAISGSHMAIIFLMILFVLNPFFSVKYRNIPIYISLAAIWGFAIFIDYGNSVVRSCIMITVYYIMIFLQRKPNLLHSLALAGMMILSIDTQQLFDVGFQLSFLAVFGIFWLYKPITNHYKPLKNRAIRFILNTFSLSLAAQLTTLPLILFYFHQFSIMSVFINVVSIMVSQGFIIFSFIVSILFGIGLTPTWLLEIYDWCASFFLNMVAFFSKTDFSFVENVSIQIPELIILFVLVYLLRSVFEKPNVKTFTRFSFFILLFIFTRILTNFYFWKKEEILLHSFFKQNIVSIKQGDKVVFIVSDEANMEKINNFVIKSYITSRRIKNIEIKKVKTMTKLKINQIIYEIK